MQRLITLFSTFLVCATAVCAQESNSTIRNARHFYIKAFERLPAYAPETARIARTILVNGWQNDSEKLSEIVAEDQGVLPLVRKAARIDRCDFLPGVTLTPKTKVPHIKQVRNLGQFLVLKGRWLHHRNKPEQALECYMLTRQLGNHLAQGKTSVETFAAASLYRYANVAIADLIDSASETVLKAILAASRQIPQRASLAHMIANERAVVQTVTPDTINLGGTSTPRVRLNKLFQAQREIATVTGISRKDVNARFMKVVDEDRIFDPEVLAAALRDLATRVYKEYEEAAALKSYTAFRDASRRIQKKYGLGRRATSTRHVFGFLKDLRNAMQNALASSKRAGDVSEEQKLDAIEPVLRDYCRVIKTQAAAIVVAQMIPFFVRGAERHYWAQFDEAALTLQVVLERHKRHLGRYPSGLSELVPRYLDTVPVDPFDGAPVRYRTTEDGCYFYSVGQDLSDNGGNAGAYACPQQRRSGRQRASLGKMEGTDIVHLLPLLAPAPKPPATKAQNRSDPMYRFLSPVEPETK